jgi:hypothetical protein
MGKPAEVWERDDMTGVRMLDEARGGVTVREGRSRLLALLRGDTLALILLLGPGHAGWGGLAALTMLGMIPGAVGGVLLLVWAVISLFVCLWSYRWIEERKRRERLAALASAGIPQLASRVVALYSWPASSDREEAVAAEVFALYRQAQQSMEVEKNPRRAREMIEQGLLLADELLTMDSEEGHFLDATTNPDKPKGRLRNTREER